MRAQSAADLGAAGEAVSVAKRRVEEVEGAAAESAAQAADSAAQVAVSAAHTAELQRRLEKSLMLELKGQERLEVTQSLTLTGSRAYAITSDSGSEIAYHLMPDARNRVGITAAMENECRAG